MKKILLLFIFISFLIAGCLNDPLAGADRNYANKSTSTTTNESTVQSQVIVINEEKVNTPVLPTGSNPAKKLPKFDIAKKVEQILAEERTIAGGFNENTGVYVISVVRLNQPSLTQDELSELALTRGKKEIAAFIGQEIKANEKMEYSESQINDKTEMKSFFSSVIELDVNQMLNGVTLYKIWKDGEETVAICYLSGKTADMSTKLKEQIAKLPPDTVGVQGLAVIDDELITTAKDKALHAALRNAVEQVLGTTLAGNTQVQDNEKVRSRIFSQSKGFVEEYRIISEKASDGYYHIELVAKIAKNKLLDSYSSYLKQMGDPEFFIRTSNDELYLTFVKFFEGLGLKMTADENKAAYIIDAIGFFKKVEHPIEKIPGTQLNLWIRIFDARSGQEVLAQKNDPRKAVSFTSSGTRQKNIAIEKAFKQIKKPLHQSLNDMIAKMTSNGRGIIIKLENYNPAYLNSVTNLCRALGYVIGNDTVAYKIDGEKGNVIIFANYFGQMVDLERFWRDRIAKDYGNTIKVPDTISIETNELKMKY